MLTRAGAALAALAAPAAAQLPVPTPTQPPANFDRLNELLAPLRITLPAVNFTLPQGGMVPDGGNAAIRGLDCGNMSLGDLSIPAAADGRGTEAAIVLSALKVNCSGVIDLNAPPLPVTLDNSIALALTLGIEIRGDMQPAVAGAVPSVVSIETCGGVAGVANVSCSAPSDVNLCVIVDFALPSLLGGLINDTLCGVLSGMSAPNGTVGAAAEGVAAAMDRWAAPAPPPLSTAEAEAYLQPYLPHLSPFKENGKWALLGDLIDFIPASVIDWVIGIIIPHGTLNISVGYTVPVTLPLGAGDANLTLTSIELGGLNEFTTLQPAELESGFSWRARVAMKRVSVAAEATVSASSPFVAGLPPGFSPVVRVALPMTDVSVDATVIVALNGSTLCAQSNTGAATSLECLLAPVLADEKAGVSGLNVTNLRVSLGDVAPALTGLGDGLDGAAAGVLDAALITYKTALLRALPNGLSQSLRTLVNGAILSELSSLGTCASTTQALPIPAASRVCVVNNAGFVVDWALHDCASLQLSPSTGGYPIDQSRCIELGAVAGVAEGDLVRVAAHAALGKRQPAERAVTYAADSNTATFVCTGTTLDYACKLTSVTPITGLPAVSRICVANDAGFVLEWSATDTRNGKTGDTTSRYPIDKTRCLNLDGSHGIAGILDGDTIETTVHAIAGKTQKVSSSVVYRNNSFGATFVCKGTTLNYNCGLSGLQSV